LAALAGSCDGHQKPSTFLSICRKWCRLGSDPKDAEEFVDKACKDGRIMPNAATVNNLNKLWDAHEQLHG